MVIEKRGRRLRKKPSQHAQASGHLKRIAALSELISPKEARSIPTDLAANLHRYASASKRK